MLSLPIRRQHNRHVLGDEGDRIGNVSFALIYRVHVIRVEIAVSHLADLHCNGLNAQDQGAFYEVLTI